MLAIDTYRLVSKCQSQVLDFTVEAVCSWMIMDKKDPWANMFGKQCSKQLSTTYCRLYQSLYFICQLMGIFVLTRGTGYAEDPLPP